MKKSNIKSTKGTTNKVMTVVIIIWGLLAVGLLIYDSKISGNPIFSRTSANTTIKATVSANGTAYANYIETTQSQGYRLKLNNLPTYSGPLEVMFNGTYSKWINAKTKAPHLAKNGIAMITPDEMKTIPITPGLYPAKFRPFVSGTNPYNFSNQVIVLVKSTSGTTPGLNVKVSTDSKTWVDTIETTIDKGYYLKTIPSYQGWLEAAAGKKWLQANGNGIVHVTPQIMKSGTDDFGSTKPGTYKVKFRPHGINLDLPWSNQVTVIVNDAAKLPTNLLPISVNSCSGGAKPNDGGTYINVATWNLDGSSGWEKKFGNDRDVSSKDRAQAKIERSQYKFSMAAQKFKEKQADIIFLQEIEPVGMHLEELKQTIGSEIDKETNSTLFYQFQSEFPGKALYIQGAWTPKQSGYAIISKYPILEKDIRPLPGSTDRWLMTALIQLPNNKTVRVFNSHFGANHREGTLCGNLQSLIDYQLGPQAKGGGQVKSSEPYIFGGDFNLRLVNDIFEDHMNKRGYCNPTPAVSSVWNLNCTNPGEKNTTCRMREYDRCTGQKSKDTYSCIRTAPIDFVMSGKQGGATTYQTCVIDKYNVSEHDLLISTIRL